MFFFDLGKVNTAHGMASGMVRSAVGKWKRHSCRGKDGLAAANPSGVPVINRLTGKLHSIQYTDQDNYSFLQGIPLKSFESEYGKEWNEANLPVRHCHRSLCSLFPRQWTCISRAQRIFPWSAGNRRLPVINGEPLTLEEFERALAGIHGGMTDNTPRSLPHPSQLLERLINAKLVLQEARNIGLDELPEVQSAEKTFEEDTLRGMLYGYHVRNIRKPDRKRWKNGTGKR